jgi:hypothetical protein
MGLSGVVLAWLLCAPQQPIDAVAASSGAALEGGLALIRSASDMPGGLGLGDGGVSSASPGEGLRVGRRPGIATTPGGVQVRCQREGVLLRFPSGRELMFTPGGLLCARDGGTAGPFTGGIELRLCDGASVVVDRSGSGRAPIVEAIVTAGDSALRLFARGEPTCEPVVAGARGRESLAVRFCLGDGATVYAAAAAGPLVALRREIADGGSPWPQRRLCLLADALRASLDQLLESRSARVHPEAAAEIAVMRSQWDRALGLGEPRPPRVGSDPLTWLLWSGYELSLQDSRSFLRLQLGRHQRLPFVEWRLGYGASVACLDDSPQSGTRTETLPVALPRLQVRLLRHDLGLVQGEVQAMAAAARDPAVAADATIGR